MLLRAVVLCATATYPSMTMSQQAASSPAICTGQQSDIDSVGKKYAGLFAGYEAEGNALKDSDDAKKFDVDLTWEDTEIKFGTPSVKIVDQRMTFGVPQVTMRTKDIVFGTPSVRMKRVKTGQYPEFTCHDTWISLPFGGKTKGAPACTVKWSNTYADIPETFMQEQRIKLDIPEFTFDNTSIVIGVPEFFMEEQRIVFGVPQVKVASVILNSEPLREKADQLSTKVADTKTAQAQEMGSATHLLFECYRSALKEQRATAEAQFTTGLAQMDGIIQSLKAQGADPTKVAGADGTTVNLVSQRDELARQQTAALAKFDESLAKLDLSEKTAIEKMNI